MLIQIMNKIANLSGYQLMPSNDVYVNLDQIYTNNKQGHALFSYTKEDGTFDYEKYKAVQEEGNKNKIHQVWAMEDNIKFLAEYLNEELDNVKFGICHGTRRGKEQEWFMQYLKGDAEVIGTEISETATEFPNTIQWDFHEVKPEWENAVDFVYSNSFDHSYDPEKCLNAWMSSVRSGGVCILEHTDHHETNSSRELDPFGAYLIQMPLLISRWGAGKYGVREVLKAPAKNGAVKFVACIIIEKY